MRKHPYYYIIATVLLLSLAVTLVDAFLKPAYGPKVLPILFVGLFVGGCIFNYLNETSENIYTSWAAHMFANFAINTVGFLLFGIL